MLDLEALLSIIIYIIISWNKVALKTILKSFIINGWLYFTLNASSSIPDKENKLHLGKVINFLASKSCERTINSSSVCCTVIFRSSYLIWEKLSTSLVVKQTFNMPSMELLFKCSNPYIWKNMSFTVSKLMFWFKF